MMIAQSAAALWARKYTVFAGAVVIALVVWLGFGFVRGAAVEVDTVKRAELVETVVATGSVQTPFRVSIASQITGTVAEVSVDEGQRVVAGQTLILLDARELLAAADQAKAAVAEALSHMGQLTNLTLPSAREALMQAQATMLNAQQTYDRTAELTAHGNATRVALESAQKALDIGRTQVRTAQLQVATAMPGGSDYVTGQTLLNQARAASDTAQSRLGYATIVSPRAGVLITRTVERGTVAQIGQSLLTLAPDGETQLLLGIDERNLAKLKLGEAAIASADAYADQKFAAVVSYINPAVDIAHASVQVKLTVATPPAYLRQDMTVSVDIEIARRPAALVLAGRGVHDLLLPAPWVMVIRSGRAVHQAVKLGIQGTTQVEILAGLTEGDAVIPATAPVVAGQRVHAAP